VFCYYGSWATYRSGIAKFDVEDIDASLCTHIVYTFMGLKDGQIASLDEYNDFEENWGKGQCIYIILNNSLRLTKHHAMKAYWGWRNSVTRS